MRVGGFVAERASFFGVRALATWMGNAGVGDWSPVAARRIELGGVRTVTRFTDSWIHAKWECTRFEDDATLDATA
jgi:hypothetical protein